MDKKVLVIDDSTTVRQQVRAALFGNGFEILEAADGAEGLAAMVEQRDLAAVLCDVNMPRMDGLKMLELAKAKGLLATLPVVILTTEGRPTLQAKALGAKAWIIKPFRPALLVAAIRKLTAG